MDEESTAPDKETIIQPSSRRTVILFALLTMGLVLASHLIPPVAASIGKFVQFTTGQLTTTARANAETILAETKLRELETALQIANDTNAANEVELFHMRNAIIIADANLSDEKILTASLRSDLTISHDAFAALQVAIGTEREATARMVQARIKTVAALNNSRARIKRLTASNLGATFGESIPVFGIGVVAGATAYEVTEACAAMNEMTALIKLLDPAEFDAQDNDHTEVCGLDIPSKEELWEIVRTSPMAAWDKTKRTVSDVTDWTNDIDDPDRGEIEKWFRHVF